MNELRWVVAVNACVFAWIGESYLVFENGWMS
jgi:hypothetical protein